MELMRRYQALKEKVTERKEEFAELMMFIEKDTAYMTHQLLRNIISAASVAYSKIIF